MPAPRLTIFGAGLAGLIAARMLADRHPVVLERQPSLPNNHHALLRFRSSVVGDVTNVPFDKVHVSKFVLRDTGSNPIKDAAIYARKTTGKLHTRSIMDTRPAERYIAPKDFVQRLASTADIRFGEDFQQWSHNLAREHGPIISTIPVPVMMDLFDWSDKPDFSSKEGWTIRVHLKPETECALNGTLYSARQRDEWYRASLTGDLLMIEGAGPAPELGQASEIMKNVCWFDMGINDDDIHTWEVHPAKYQKISDLRSVDRESVKRFIMWLSDEHQIYSLGRFATWRPKLLLDDLVNDVRVIARLIEGESQYNETLSKKA